MPVHLGPGDPSPALAEALMALGLRRDPWTSPVMALTTHLAAAGSIAELRIAPVDATTYASWLHAFAGSFEAYERARGPLGRRSRPTPTSS